MYAEISAGIRLVEERKSVSSVPKLSKLHFSLKGQNGSEAASSEQEGQTDPTGQTGNAGLGPDLEVRQRQKTMIGKKLIKSFENKRLFKFHVSWHFIDDLLTWSSPYILMR